MPSNDSSDDRAARKARADAIRRARDQRNAKINTPAEADASANESTAAAEEEAPPDPKRQPNYVEFIDRKMRQPKKS